jgi:hypothetical protein
MNQLKQLYHFYRYKKLTKKFEKIIPDFFDRNLIQQYLEKDRERFHNTSPYLRKAVCESYKTILKKFPFEVNQDWVEGKEKYFKLKEAGLLVDETPSDYYGKWLTAVVSQGAYKGEKFSEYWGGEYSPGEEIDYKPKTFFVERVHSVGDWKLVNDIEISRCRLATEEEIKKAEEKEELAKQWQKQVDHYQTEIQKAYNELSKYKSYDE